MDTLVSTATTRYGVMTFFENDSPLGASLKQYGEWAQFELNILLPLIRAGDTVIDVGANIGTHTIAFAAAVAHSGKVLSFEPQPVVAELLRKNLLANGFPEVVVRQQGVAEKKGFMHIEIPSYHDKSNVGAASLSNEAWDNSLKVPVIKLDALGLKQCRLIKIDSEGMGIKVLRGASELITKTRPFISLELDEIGEAQEIFDFFKAREYQMVFFECPAFNAGNFAGSSDNFFGFASEGMLMAVSNNEYVVLKEVCKFGTLVHDSAHLCRLVYEIARFGDESPNDRKAGVLKALLHQSENKAKMMELRCIAEKQQVEALIESMNVKNAEIDMLREESKRVHYREALLRDRVDYLEKARSPLAAHSRELQAIYNSTSWRITAPLRKLKQFF
ncbi:FkbM family methyltransferase [Brucella rhizosphaerae]|uniref:FkbM family methyltransferase n=1 Tax=Brucella rhizosphaerae TaxID=571254 RepID=UPI000463F9BF|nr:FkbM family methyltransferase [Brucella rhizosphaerae]